MGFSFKKPRISLLLRQPVRKLLLEGTVLVAVLILLSASAPLDFPVHSIVRVPKGVILGDIAGRLEEKDIIRAPRLFIAAVEFFGDEKKVKSGHYLLNNPENAISLAFRFARGKFGVPAVSVRIPEGFSSHEIIKLFDGRFFNLDRKEFVRLAAENEGYLFPDTYFFYPTMAADEIVEIMRENFNEKTKSLTADILRSEHSQKETIIMASIIEREALKEKDKFLVSGVLWNRIKIGMPLQVDAPFAYISDKSTYELTRADLAGNSPYNTYKNRGLPPTPIGNPGLVAIRAAIEPTESSYLYYLSDRSGNVYYAKTFEEHKLNRIKYLGK